MSSCAVLVGALCLAASGCRTSATAYEAYWDKHGLKSVVEQQAKDSSAAIGYIRQDSNEVDSILAGALLKIDSADNLADLKAVVREAFGRRTEFYHSIRETEPPEEQGAIIDGVRQAVRSRLGLATRGTVTFKVIGEAPGDEVYYRRAGELCVNSTHLGSRKEPNILKGMLPGRYLWECSRAQAKPKSGSDWKECHIDRTVYKRCK